MSGIVSLKQNVDFRRLYRRGKCAVMPTLVVYAMSNRRGENRLGVTAGKKVGCAVRRNRAKRRIRALFEEYVHRNMLNYEALKNRKYDFVIVARALAVDVEFSRLERDFAAAVNKALKQISG